MGAHGGWPGWYRRAWLPIAALGVVVFVGGVAFSFGGSLVRGGLRPCATLDERLCADLGSDGCDTWKGKLHRAGAGSSMPRRMRRGRTALLDMALHAVLPWDESKEDNPLCYDQLSDRLYAPTLAAIRTMVDGSERSK
jgi:hypothetical protein